MKTYIQAHGFDVWWAVVDGYKAPPNPSKNKDGNKLEDNDSRARNDFLNGLTESIYTKVVNCESTKEIWDKLKNIYEVYARVKRAKIQTLRVKFEQLKMKKYENIASYFLRVDEIINSIKVLGEEMKEKIIFQKVLRSLPMIYDPKIWTLKERTYLHTLIMDELHGILTTYEMRTE